MLALWKKIYDKPREHIKKHKHHFADESHSYDFSCSHVWMWELDHKEGWAPKNWCFHTMLPEKTLQSSLDCKEIETVNPKANQSWIFIGRTDAEADAPILWPPDVKSWLTGKDSDAGKDWGHEERRATENAMVGWHHWLNGHGFEQTPGDSEGQGTWCAAVHGVAKSGTQLGDWKTMNSNHTSTRLQCLWKYLTCFEALSWKSTFEVGILERLNDLLKKSHS